MDEEIKIEKENNNNLKIEQDKLMNENCKLKKE